MKIILIQKVLKVRDVMNFTNLQLFLFQFVKYY